MQEIIDQAIFKGSVFSPSEDDISAIFVALETRGQQLESSLSNTPLYRISSNDGQGQDLLVKTGRNTSIYEAWAMVFVRAYTNIPVPQVHMAFTDGSGKTYIVMDFIEGTQLTMCPEENLPRVLLQLHGIIGEIRDLGRRFLPSKQCFGSWLSGPYVNSYFRQPEPKNTFSSIEEFHDYFLKRLQNKTDTRLIYQAVEEVKRQTQGLNDPVLTHGDLAPRNILVQGSNIVAILDWETLGLYPEFWEEMCLRNQVMKKIIHEAINQCFGQASLDIQRYRYAINCT